MDVDRLRTAHRLLDRCARLDVLQLLAGIRQPRIDCGQQLAIACSELS